MAVAKHTPGPWSVDLGEVYAVLDCEGGRVALLTNLRGPHGMAGRRPGAEVAANTHLVAAAPQLLEQLQRLLRAYREAVKLYDPNHDDAYTVDAHNAIAKALGGPA